MTHTHSTLLAAHAPSSSAAAQTRLRRCPGHPNPPAIRTCRVRRPRAIRYTVVHANSSAKSSGVHSTLAVALSNRPPDRLVTNPICESISRSRWPRSDSYHTLGISSLSRISISRRSRSNLKICLTKSRSREIEMDPNIYSEAVTSAITIVVLQGSPGSSPGAPVAPNASLLGTDRDRLARCAVGRVCVGLV